MTKEILGSIVLSLTVALTGCTAEVGDGRPSAAAPSEAVANETATTTETGCEPGESRDCRFYYTTADGRTLCPMKTQYCRTDGSGWLPCGDAPEE